jgi:hypothetical protein
MAKDIFKDLQTLREITPRSEYVAQSRADILSTPKSFYIAQPKQFGNGRGIVWESLSLSLSTIMSAAVVLIMLGGATGIIRVIVFNNLSTGVDTEGIIAEAGAASKDIDIQLNEARYYNIPTTKISTTSVVISTNVTVNNNPKSSDVDRALKEASQ